MGKTKDITLFGDIEEETVQRIYDRVQELNQDKEVDKVRFLINSLGGEVTSTVTIAYILEEVIKPVEVEILGEIGSCAAFLVCMLKNQGCKVACHRDSKFMIHTSRLEGNYANFASELKDSVRSIKGANKIQTREIAKATKLGKKKIRKIVDGERDYEVVGKKIQKIGLADRVIK